MRVRADAFFERGERAFKEPDYEAARRAYAEARHFY
jgi:hypothetical protein